MKSPSLDALYLTLHKHMLLAQSYSEVQELFFIIKTCRLKPYDYVMGERSEKLLLYKWWLDEFSNSLHILKSKRLEIVYNDLNIDRDKIVCTDLYYGLSLDRVAKMSKLVYLCAGKDEDLLEDAFFLTFLGLDNYLRSYMLLHGEWQQVSPLLLGLKNLKLIAHNADIKYFRQFENKEDMPIACASARQWLSFLPLSPSLLTQLDKQYEQLLPIFK
jgi:hypothetical protein